MPDNLAWNCTSAFPDELLGLAAPVERMGMPIVLLVTRLPRAAAKGYSSLGTKRVYFQAIFSGFTPVPIALICAGHNLQSAI
jgi:hypothetical protein